MNTIFKRILVGVAASVAVSTAAFAADIAPVVIPAPAPVVVVPAAPAFDWAGIYAGTAVDYLVCDGFCWLKLDGHAGANMVFGRLLVGVEVGAGYWRNATANAGWLIEASARTGVVLGRFLPYAKAGYTLYGDPTGLEGWLNIGAGAELALGRSLSVYAGFTAERPVSDPGFFPGVEVGVNFHFGH